MEVKLPAITKAKLILTNECQLSCKYCYQSASKDIMSLDTAKKSIDFILANASSANKIPDISFFGGEPLIVYEELMKPCIEYIRDTLHSRCSISFTTNGILLDESKLTYLKSKNVRFMLSLDGCESSHNENRVYASGRGSFSDISKNIPMILKYFPTTRARMTLTPTNAKYLYESVQYVHSAGFIDMHIIPDLFILSQDRWDDECFKTLGEQMSLLEEYVIDTFESDEVPLIFKTLADMFPRIVLNLQASRNNHHRVASCCLPTRRCGIGVLENVIIDTQGKIFSCQHGDHEASESNPLFLGSLEEGIREERRYSLLGMNQTPLRAKTLDCSVCHLNNVCTGGCVPNNYAMNGDFSIVPDAYCKWTRLMYDSAVRIVEHFDERQDNLLFKDYFYGVVKRGVACVC